MTSSVSTELGLLPGSVEEKAPQEMEEDITTNEIDDGVSSIITFTEKEEQIKSAAEGQIEAEVEAGTQIAQEAEHNFKVVTPTSVPTLSEFAPSVSKIITETNMSLSSEMGDLLQAHAEDGEDSGDSPVASQGNTSDGEQEAEQDGSGEEPAINHLEDEAEVYCGGSAAADDESHFEGHDAEDVVASADDEKGTSTKGTLIFDLGPAATPELRDLVQQTVLDALMDEGLLASADVTPVFQVEGSGVIFNDDVEGSAGKQDSSGDTEDSEAASSSPYVSIHF